MSTDAHPPTTDPTTTPPPVANGTGPPQPSESLLAGMVLVDELLELEKQFPAPDEDAVFANARWFEEHLGKPELMQYRGTHVAVMNGAVVGHGDNSLQLQLDIARKYKVHPQSFLVE